ncbi:MAG: hypothetical protein IKJ65_00180 [Clostridia bacterium]|nr:hypothetical protein [Clostridia bacterium]
MSTIAYKCPCCASPLAYGAESGKLDCASCSNSFDLESIEAMQIDDTKSGVKFERPTERFDSSDGEQIAAYTCQSCGAELMTEGTTTATECPYCGSHTILPERINAGVKPELVVPFTVTKEKAQDIFNGYFTGKPLLPNIFKDSRNRISEMRRLFVPYWLFDCDAHGSVVYNAEKRRTERRGDWEIEKIDHYIVRRNGSMSFENIPVDGSEKMDNRITESIEPYDLTAAVPFQPAVLAGSMADHADVDAEKCEERATERVENSLADALRSTVTGYTRVNERGRNIFSENGKAKPALLPVWLITTEKAEKTYTFAINGQTGALTCDVPADTKKTLLWGGGVFAGVMGVFAVILAIMDALGGAALLISAIAALIIALITVSVLISQLKQASHQNAAGNYVRKDSFRITARSDHFLYRTTNRRKIENNNK